MKTEDICFWAYVAIGFLVFGYVYNSHELRHCVLRHCAIERGVGSGAAAVFWPFYFIGKGAIIATKPLAE